MAVPNYPTIISFENKRPDEEYVDPYINIADPAQGILDLINSDEEVAPNRIELLYEYPLTEQEIRIHKQEKPFTRRQLVLLVCEDYKKIYQEEDLSIPTPAGNIPGMYNRERSNGKYGIWGHHLDDLVLYQLKRKEDGVYKVVAE